MMAVPGAVVAQEERFDAFLNPDDEVPRPTVFTGTGMAFVLILDEESKIH